MPQSRRSPAKRPLDLMALKFIRMVMASYFIALSVDVIQGVNMAVFFAPFMSAPMAEQVGSAVVLYFAALLFFGLFLRLSSLYLAIMMLTSSMMQNFFQSPTGSIDAFWHDLVIVCGLLLTYCTLSPRDLKRQAFIMNYMPAPVMHVAGKVAPRRVTTAATVPAVQDEPSFADANAHLFLDPKPRIDPNAEETQPPITAPILKAGPDKAAETADAPDTADATDTADTADTGDTGDTEVDAPKQKTKKQDTDLPDEEEPINIFAA